MENIYYNTFTARTEYAERLQNHGRDYITLGRIRPFASIVNWASQANATVSRFVGNVQVELQNWLDSQRACQSGTPILADC